MVFGERRWRRRVLKCRAVSWKNSCSGVSLPAVAGSAMLAEGFEGPSRDDLPTVPQRRLLPLASRRCRGFSLDACRSETLAVPDMRPAILRMAGSSIADALCALSEVRKFRFGRDLARTCGERNASDSEAPASSPRISMRSLPRAILQHSALPAYCTFHGSF
jgi:hypothetical protein